jgi:hypothetical protein
LLPVPSGTVSTGGGSKLQKALAARKASIAKSTATDTAAPSATKRPDFRSGTEESFKLL